MASKEYDTAVALVGARWQMGREAEKRGLFEHATILMQAAEIVQESFIEYFKTVTELTAPKFDPGAFRQACKRFGT
jgi:hypothetical protein